MRAVRTSLGLGVVLIAGVLVAGASGAAPPTKSEKHHHVHGVVVEIDHFKAKKGHGAIKVRSHEHAKGQNKGGEAKTKSKGEHVVTVHVNHHTRFEKVSHFAGKGNKGGTREVLAHFRDLEPGMHVRVRLDHGHHAEEVSILVEHHDGKGKDKGKGKK
jgi:hypothetical protein